VFAVKMREAAHRPISGKSDLAIETVAPEIHEAAAALKNPSLDREIHLPAPILRMHSDDQHAIGVEWQKSLVKMAVPIKVVVEPFPLQPSI
jgi:hypothetical protein